MTSRKIIALVDDELDGVSPITEKIGSLKRNRDRKKINEIFQLVPVIVEPNDSLAEDAHKCIIKACGRIPDLVLVDQKFGDQGEASFEIGRDLALALRERIDTPLGVYSKHELPEFQRLQLTSDRFAIVLDQLAIRDWKSSSPKLTGDQWAELFEKTIEMSAAAKREDSPCVQTRSSAHMATDTGCTESTSLRAESFVTADNLRPEQNLTAMHPKGWHGLYVIGSFDKRITFYSQQVRALTLVRALFEDQGLRRGERVAVIGGGAAGITAAVATASKGCETHLYERRDSVLYVQKESMHRYLHPHIYDWPHDGSTESDAQLPLLNWAAGYAHEIAAALRDKVKEFEAADDISLSVHTNSRITKCEKTGETQKRIRIVGNEGSNEGKIDERFNVVVIANGYGRDDNQPSTPSYWSPDEITASHDKEKRHILDGGLVDLARATLRDFRHDEILGELVGLESLGREMEQIDETARRELRHNGTTPNLRNAYEKLNTPTNIVEKIKLLKRNDTEVTFNFRDPSIFSLNSALINRLLVVLLMKAGVVKQKHAEIKEDAVKRLENGRYRVSFNGDDDTAEFDLVILRHGPARDYFKKRWPGIAPDCKELGGKLAELGLTGKLSVRTCEWYARHY